MCVKNYSVHYLLVGGLGFRLGNSGFSTGDCWVEAVVGERGALSDLCLAAVSRISCSSLVPKSRNSVKLNYSMYGHSIIYTYQQREPKF